MEKKITRRNVLKTVLAASGAIAASTLLPSQWVKPVVTAGVLPVHAQVSSSANGVRGRQNGNNVYAEVSSNPLDDFSFIYGKTGLASIGGHAKHAAPARIRLQYPVANVKVTLYISDNQTGPWTKYTLSTNPLTTDVNGVTGNWDVTDYLNKWARFVISSGDEDIHQIAS